MNPAKLSTRVVQVRASQLLRMILMSDTCGEGIESNIVFGVGAHARSTVASILHLVTAKRSEVAVTGFLQKISTSFVKVIRYSQSARADYIVSTYVHMHMA